jgi:cell division septal protein FtsQ
MPTTARNRGTFQISARILVVGLWTVLFGMFILLFTMQMFATLSSFTSIGVLGQESGTGVDAILFDSLLMLYRGGFLTLGAGGALMAFGSLFVIGVTR